MIRVLQYLIAVVLLSCMSESTPDQRVDESLALSHPAVSVALTDPNRFCFTAVGDLHVGNQDTSRFRRILNEASSRNHALVVLLGDIIDKGKREDYQAVKTAVEETGWQGRVLYVIGNHDVFAVDGQDGWTNYKEFFGPSFHVHTLGNATFIALDTADGTVLNREWLESELDKKTTTHTFLISHYLPVLPGVRSYLKLANEREANALMRLASDKGVTAWLGGHYHSYLFDEYNGVSYVAIGGGGGRRMTSPIFSGQSFFLGEICVVNSQVTYNPVRID